MNTMSRLLKGAFVLVLFAGLMLLAGGCDDAVTDGGLTVTPNAVDLATPGSVVLTAARPEQAGAAEGTRSSELLLPLEWSVLNPDLGQVISRGGYEAVYVGQNRSGQNIVFVKDRNGREGLATINQ